MALEFKSVTAPATVRKVMDNPFLDAVKNLAPDSGSAIEVVLENATQKDVNRANRQLTDAGNELDVTVRRQLSEIDGSDDVRIVFWTVAKIKRGESSK